MTFYLYLILVFLTSLTLRKVSNMSKELDDLKAQVTASIAVEASAVTLITGIAAQLAALIAAGSDPAALSALSAELKASADALGAAVAANTPAAPPVV